MYSFLGRLAAILGVLLLCSCNTSTFWSVSKVAGSGIEPPQLSSPAPSNVLRLTLQCTTYIETTWGSRVGELGLCPASSEELRYPYPPVPNAQGDLFILDIVNQRILQYSKSMTPQVIPIPSPYVFRDPCSYSTRGLSNLGVNRDRLFIHFPAYRDGRLVEHLAVLSPDGREERVISLEAYYPHYPISAPVADTDGGCYLWFPLFFVYFDAGFRPEVIGTGANEMDSGGLVVGWDGNLYTYSSGRDHLINWGGSNDRFRRGAEPINSKTGVISAIQTASFIWKKLLGVDTQGQLYFALAAYEQGAIRREFVRVSAPGDEVAIATVPDGTLLDEVVPWFSLAPDGSLYGMSYGLGRPDPSLNPRVVKCVFGQ